MPGIGLGPRQRRLDVGEGGDGRPAAPAPARPVQPKAAPGQSVPATRGSSAARWIAATASRSSIGRPPPVMKVSGSKPAGLRRHGLQVELEDAAVGHPVVAGGVDAAQRVADVVGTRDSGQEGEHTVEATGADAGAGRHARTVELVRYSISIPQFDVDGFDAEGLRSYLTRAEELGFEGGWTLEQIIGPTPLLAPMELLAWAAACTTTTAPGGGRAGHLAARPTAAGLDGHRRRPAQPRPPGARRRARRWPAQVRGLRRRPGHLHQQLHRGFGVDEGGLVRRAAGDVSRPVPRRRRSADRPEAGAAAAPADLVRRQRPSRDRPRGTPRRRVHGRRFVDDGGLRDRGADPARANSPSRTRIRRHSGSASGCT